MSIDYDIVNDRDKTCRYFGFANGGGFRIGYGANDEAGRKAISDWIFEQVAQNGVLELRIVNMESVPDDYVRQENDDEA